MSQEYYFMDGKHVKAEEAMIPVRTHAFLYGTSVFEGIRAYWNADKKQLYAFRIKEHIERMINSGKILFMDAKYTVDEYIEIIRELLEKNDYHEDCYIRPEIYKSALKIGPGLIDNPDGILIFTIKLGDYIDTRKGLKVCVSSWDRLEDNALPPRAKVSGGYVNPALMITQARMSGFDDAISLSQNGHVAEGSAMNFFIVQDGKLITTPMTSNILIGVTRNTVMQIAKEDLGLEIIEREIDRTELYVADEAFFCGTGAQIAPIGSIDHRQLGTGNIGPVTEKIQKLYFDIVKGKVDKYSHWLTPVYKN